MFKKIGIILFRKERVEVYFYSFLIIRRVVIKRIMISIFVLGYNDIKLFSEEFKLRFKDEYFKCVRGK